MRTTIRNHELIAFYAVYQAVSVVYPARPPPGEIAPERFRIVYAVIAVALYILNKLVDSFYCFLSCVCQYR
jgi:hypothetical protein